MSKIIGFNADERLKLMASALASRLGYPDVSTMMRALLEEKINTTFSSDEREQLIRLLSPSDKVIGTEFGMVVIENQSRTRPFAASQRQAKHRKAAS